MHSPSRLRSPCAPLPLAAAAAAAGAVALAALAAAAMGYEGWQNTSMARVPLELPAAYGYVLLSAFVSVVAIGFLSESVAQARKKCKVDYPLLYADQYAVRAAARIMGRTVE